jgi:hypothetical protein
MASTQQKEITEDLWYQQNLKSPHCLNKNCAMKVYRRAEVQPCTFLNLELDEDG